MFFDFCLPFIEWNKLLNEIIVEMAYVQARNLIEMGRIKFLGLNKLNKKGITKEKNDSYGFFTMAGAGS